MDENELRAIVDAIVNNKRLGNRRPHELLDSIHRKKFPATFLPVIEPLLRSTDRVTYKSAIDIVGKMKGASEEASAAVEAAWERSWFHDVPQACTEAFRALIRIGNNEQRLLAMIERTMKVDNYGIHKECAEALMKLQHGDAILSRWNETIAGKCDCHLHQKLSEKITKHLNTQ